MERCRRHQLIDIVFIAMCAVICGAEAFTEMEEFGPSKEVWLRQFLELPNGIPSPDTVGRVLARLDPQAFEACFERWGRGVGQLREGEVVGIDGNTLRRSYDRAAGQSAIQVVSAWARTNRLTLGQVKVAAAANAITAGPEGWRVLDLTGCIVTVDALNTQKETARQIRAQAAEYVLALKDNHPTLHQPVADFLQAAHQGHTLNDPISTHQTVEKDHGRIETRIYWQVEAPPHLHEFEPWPDLRRVGLVQATREGRGQTTGETRYYLSPLPVEAGRVSDPGRGHWAVENSCHWILDVVFREDDSRVRRGHAPENLAVIRRWAHNLLAREPSVNRGLKTKRLKAALVDRYLLQILTL